MALLIVCRSAKETPTKNKFGTFTMFFWYLEGLGMQIIYSYPIHPLFSRENLQNKYHISEVKLNFSCRLSPETNPST